MQCLHVGGQAINNVKANAAAVTKVTSVKPESTRLPKPEHSVEFHHNKPEPSTGLPKPRPSSILPSDFFDNQETKKQKTGKSLSWVIIFPFSNFHFTISAHLQPKMIF